jgi:hypothetical protein
MHFKQKVEKSQDRIIIYLTKVGKKLTLALQSTIGVDSFMVGTPRIESDKHKEETYKCDCLS